MEAAAAEEQEQQPQPQPQQQPQPPRSRPPPPSPEMAKVHLAMMREAGVYLVPTITAGKSWHQALGQPTPRRD